MKFSIVAITIVGIVVHAAAAFAGANTMVNRTTLGVPSYPGWTIHRLDDQADPSGKTRVYQYQYYSNDSASQIVKYYEHHLNTTASFTEPTHTHSLNAPDGAMIQVTVPPGGVPQVGEDGQPTGKTWTSLITIIRFQAQ